MPYRLVLNTTTNEISHDGIIVHKNLKLPADEKINDLLIAGCIFNKGQSLRFDEASDFILSEFYKKLPSDARFKFYSPTLIKSVEEPRTIFPHIVENNKPDHEDNKNKNLFELIEVIDEISFLSSPFLEMYVTAHFPTNKITNAEFAKNVLNCRMTLGLIYNYGPQNPSVEITRKTSNNSFEVLDKIAFHFFSKDQSLSQYWFTRATELYSAKAHKYLYEIFSKSTAEKERSLSKAKEHLLKAIELSTEEEKESLTKIFKQKFEKQVNLQPFSN